MRCAPYAQATHPAVGENAQAYMRGRGPCEQLASEEVASVGRELGLETLEDYLETKSVLVSTSARPHNPFQL